MKKEHVEEYRKLAKIDPPKDKPTVSAQQRGIEFEKLFNDIFAAEKILLQGSYRTSDNGSEQIDGAIKICDKIFLVEVKWVESGIAASDLYAFIGKVENKFSGTLGVFISKAELSDNFLNSLNKGRRQSIIVIHGEDIELIFDNDISLKEYIEVTLRQLSMDNIVHFPVKKYLEIIKSKNDIDIGTKIEIEAQQKQPSSRVENVATFIQDNLFKQQTPFYQLQRSINTLNSDDRNIAFEYLLRKYSTYYYSRLLDNNPATYFRLDNIKSFIKLYQETTDNIPNDIVERYYSELIEKHFGIYSCDLFVKLFSKNYNLVSEAVKDKFELFLHTKWKESYDTYNTENQLTELIEPIWDKLYNETKEKLSFFYLDIYIRNSRDWFPQKRFANDLLKHGKITKAVIEYWLKDKVKENKDACSSLDENDRLDFIARTFGPIATHLKIETDDEWVVYIKKIIDSSN